MFYDSGADPDVEGDNLFPRQLLTPSQGFKSTCFGKEANFGATDACALFKKSTKKELQPKNEGDRVVKRLIVKNALLVWEPGRRETKTETKKAI